MFPTEEACAIKDIFCFEALANANNGTMYTDLFGAFPVRLFKNMQYIFVACIYDLNAIIVHPMPSRTDASMIDTFTEVIAILRSRDYHPALIVMDNKCSKAVETHIRTKKMIIQLVSPLNHRVNVAKRAITATVNMLCPLQLWDGFFSTG
jgi:hypothetical protein